MTGDLNPQAEQMADESMVRNLSAQAQAIWPQERALFARYALDDDARILDAGCGTGEITSRLAELFPRAALLGVDVVPSHLERARARCAQLGDRVRFEERDIYALGLPDDAFDLTVCRHVLQALPQTDRVLAELVRVTRPGGRLHLIAEDYGMIHFQRGRLDADAFWNVAPRAYGEATGTDVYVGRNVFTTLRRLGLEEISVDYVVVDPLRTPRATMAAIFAAWRDGYAGAFEAHTPFTRAAATAHFDDMLATLADPDGYAVWHVPVIAARVP